MKVGNVICQVCFCLVDDGHLPDHMDWHRTLANRPKEVK